MMNSKTIHFVTDSTCDLPPDVLAKYPITVVPTYINYGDASYADDGKALIREDFYNALPGISPYPTTSAMSPGMAEAMVTAAFQGADHLFIITVASKLSAVYNTLKLGAHALPPDRVTLIDSQTLSFGLGFQVLIGAEIAAATGDVEAVHHAILQVQKHQRVFAALDTIKYLHLSGRINWAAASLGNLLQIKPIIYVSAGEVRSASRVRTFSRALDELVRLVSLQAPLDRITLLYAHESEVLQQLHERLAPMVTNAIMSVSITPTIGVHTGPDGVGVVTLSSAWRE